MYLTKIIIKNRLLATEFRSSPPEVFLGESVLKICSKLTGEHPYKFTGKQPCQNVILQLYWNHTSAWVLFCKSATYFQNTFSLENLLRAASVGCIRLYTFCRTKAYLAPYQTYIIELIFDIDVWLGSKYASVEVMLKLITTNVPHHIETSQLICNVNQLTGFYYIIRNIGR